MATRKNGKPTPPPPAADVDVDALDQDEENALPWEEDLALWEQEERQDGDWFKLILYRRLDNGKGKEKVWEWMDENPGSHAIGMEFGGGKYTAFAILPPAKQGGKPRIRTRHFILANSYTEKKRMRDRDNGFAPTYPPGFGGQGPAVQQASDFEKFGAMMEKFVLPILEMSMRMQPQQLPAPAADMKGMAAMMSGTLNQVILDGAKNQIAITKELTRELNTMRQESKPAARDDDEDEDAEPSDFDWKEFLKESLETYGPKLLELSGIKEKFAAKELKSNTIFQTLAGNKTLFERVYGMLIKDDGVDRDMVDRVLQKMSKMGVGFNVVPTMPTNGHAAPHTAAAGTAAHAS